MNRKISITAALIFMALFTACQSTGGARKDDEAVRAFERAEALYKREAFKDAIAEYTKAIELEPEWAEAFLGRGNARVWGLDANDALGQEDYDKAAALDPQYQDFAQGVRYYMNNNISRATETFNKVIQNNINLMDSYSFRGNLYHVTGEYEKAIADHAEAIRLNPNFSGNYPNRAAAYNETGQYDMAIADCDRALNLQPDSFYGYLVRGETYLKKEDTERALADLTRAIQLNPDTKRGSAFYPYFLRASIYYQAGAFSRAIPDFSQVIRLLPNDSVSYIDRGYCYLQIGDYNKAAADIDTALRLDPGNEEALWIRDEIRAAR